MCVCVCVYMCALSHIQFFAIPWTVACQAPLSVEFSRQEYWSGLPCSPPGDLLNPHFLCLLHWQGAVLYHCATWEALVI